MKYRSMIIIILLLSTFTIHDANAFSAEGGTKSVISLRFEPDGLSVALLPAPTNCGGGDQYGMHAKVALTHANYNAITSALLTAYTANKTFDYIWVNNEGTCSPTHILSLELIQFSPQ